MADQKKERVYRSKEERKAALDAKIKWHRDQITTLELKKKHIDEAKRGGNRKKGLKRQVAESGLNDAELAAALGMSVEEYSAKIQAAAEAKQTK